jgi:hypothetical protein
VATLEEPTGPPANQPTGGRKRRRRVEQPSSDEEGHEVEMHHSTSPKRGEPPTGPKGPKKTQRGVKSKVLVLPLDTRTPAPGGARGPATASQGPLRDTRRNAARTRRATSDPSPAKRVAPPAAARTSGRRAAPTPVATPSVEPGLGGSGLRDSGAEHAHSPGRPGLGNRRPPGRPPGGCAPQRPRTRPTLQASASGSGSAPRAARGAEQGGVRAGLCMKK